MHRFPLAPGLVLLAAATLPAIFGLNAARQPDGFAETALKLAEYRKLSPGPIEEFVFYDHPSGRNRILMAMRWKKEHLAELPAAPIAGAPALPRE